MTNDEIAKLARQAGITGMLTDVVCEWANIVKFAELVAVQELQKARMHVVDVAIASAVATERADRQAAQAENADLKGRLACSGVERRQAVRDEREECAKAARNCLSGIGAEAAIRARVT